MIQEGQELIARPADLGLKRSCQVAGARGGEDAGQVPIQAPPLGGQRHGLAIARRRLGTVLLSRPYRIAQPCRRCISLQRLHLTRGWRAGLLDGWRWSWAGWDRRARNVGARPPGGWQMSDTVGPSSSTPVPTDAPQLAAAEALRLATAYQASRALHVALRMSIPDLLA